MYPRIVCAAVQNEFTKDIIIGIRHYDAIMRKQMELSPQWGDPAVQGFIDQFGKFYTREEAWVVAELNDQIIRRVGGDNGKLFSENLY